MIETKTDTAIEQMTNAEIKAEFKLVQARLDEIESVIDPLLTKEIEILREYALTLKGTYLARQ